MAKGGRNTYIGADKREIAVSMAMNLAKRIQLETEPITLQDQIKAVKKSQAKQAIKVSKEKEEKRIAAEVPVFSGRGIIARENMKHIHTN